jgi:isopenicillin N synthase-like dioxygenase
MTRQRVAQEIVTACKEVGFVYITNHSLPETMLDEAFDWSGRFFKLAQDEKLKAPHPPGWAVHRGYSWPGLEKVSQAMSTDVDEEVTGQLREIPDIKVRTQKPDMLTVFSTRVRGIRCRCRHVSPFGTKLTKNRKATT